MTPGIAHDLAQQPRPIRTSVLQLRPTLQAPLHARQAIDALLEGVGNPRFAFFVRLVASELVENAMLYGSPNEPIAMTVRVFPDSAELRVRNTGGPLRLKRLRGRRRDGGRGLQIVDELTDSWSIDTGPVGTEITVRLSIDQYG